MRINADWEGKVNRKERRERREKEGMNHGLRGWHGLGKTSRNQDHRFTQMDTDQGGGNQAKETHFSIVSAAPAMACQDEPSAQTT